MNGKSQYLKSSTTLNPRHIRIKKYKKKVKNILTFILQNIIKEFLKTIIKNCFSENINQIYVFLSLKERIKRKKKKRMQPCQLQILISNSF